MLKEFLKQNRISVYKLSQISGIAYSTLNDLVNHKVDVANMKAGILHRLADCLHITMDELYRLCLNEIQVYCERFSVNGNVHVKNKKYVLSFIYDELKYTDELCPVKKEATMFIDTIAVWQMEKHIIDIEMEKKYVLCIKENE